MAYTVEAAPVVPLYTPVLKVPGIHPPVSLLPKELSIPIKKKWAFCLLPLPPFPHNIAWVKIHLRFFGVFSYKFNQLRVHWKLSYLVQTMSTTGSSHWHSQLQAKAVV